MILDLQPIVACPQCTYDRFIPIWIPFALVRLLAVSLVAYRRLDVVRVLELFIAYEFGYLCFFGVGNWYAHPAVAGEEVNTASEFFLLLLVSGIPAALVLKLASRHAYFQIPSRPPFTWMRALVLMLMLFGLAIGESHRAYGDSSLGSQ